MSGRLTRKQRDLLLALVEAEKMGRDGFAYVWAEATEVMRPRFPDTKPYVEVAANFHTVRALRRRGLVATCPTGEGPDVYLTDAGRTAATPPPDSGTESRRG